MPPRRMATPTPEELQQALMIDEHDLERECRDQAVMFYNVSELNTLAQSRRDEAKQKLAEIEAEVDSDIRYDAEVAGERVTEPAIKSQIKLNKRYQKAARELKILQIEVGKLSGLERSYDHRKEMLKLLVRLYLANYFGEIEERGSADVRYAKAAHAKRVNAGRPYNLKGRRNV